MTPTPAGDIFIVDDKLENISLLEQILEENGYRVRMATNGRRALAAVRTLLPDVVMLDINMPEMDGYQVCELLKDDPLTRDIPVIFISALDDVIDKVRAFKAGGTDYVVKPFQVEEVLVRIENQLTISRLRKELELRNDRLERRNEELFREREALLKAQRETRVVFNALTDLLPGTVLDGKYRLESKIGSGGFGAVYRAVHVGLNRPVAVKVFRPSSSNNTPEGLERFRREGISACRVTHPNTVSVLDFEVSPAGIAYLVMELLVGRSLADELSEQKALSFERCVEILVPACAALDEAHRSGIVHRDIKPDNIFLHRTEGGEIVKVVDFGIAKMFDDRERPDLESLTSTERIVGTPIYMSPERLQSRTYDGRSDVYSLGVVLFQMLTGRVPFWSTDGNMVKIALMHCTNEPPPPRALNPNIPEAVESIVLRTLDKNPERRPTATELADELVAVLKAVGTADSRPDAASVEIQRLEAEDTPTLRVVRVDGDGM